MMPINEDNYVDIAEQSIKELLKQVDKYGKVIPIVTTSKLRNLLAMVSDIYNDTIIENGEKLSVDMIGRINYMKIRFYYEAGREKKVKELLETAKVFDIIDGIGDSRKNYILFSRYMESLVAFRKYYGGNDE